MSPRTTPRVESRPEHSYVGKRVVMPMDAFEATVPKVTADVVEWLVQTGVQPPGVSLVRYHVIDMPGRLEVDVGLPVASALAAGGGFSRGLLPAGRYATLVYEGLENAIEANGRLIDWIEDSGESMDSRSTKAGDAFACRVETLLTDPEVEIDQKKWHTEIAIKLRD